MLYVQLLDSEWNVLDSITIGAMYSTGWLSEAYFVLPNRVCFRFIGDTDWSITVLDSAKFGTPFISSIKGVRRVYQWHYYLQVQGEPKPEVLAPK